jgi:hypothetical protein
MYYLFFFGGGQDERLNGYVMDGKIMSIITFAMSRLRPKNSRSLQRKEKRERKKSKGGMGEGWRKRRLFVRQRMKEKRELREYEGRKEQYGGRGRKGNGERRGT